MTIHKVYANITEAAELGSPIANNYLDMIDNAYKATVEALKENDMFQNFQPCGDDRAEILVEAIANYLIDCLPTQFYK